MQGKNFDRQDFDRQDYGQTAGRRPISFRPGAGKTVNSSPAVVAAKSDPEIKNNVVEVAIALIGPAQVAALCILNEKNIVVGVFPAALWSHLLPDGWEYGRDPLPDGWHARVWAELSDIAITLSARMVCRVLGQPIEREGEVREMIQASRNDKGGSANG